MSGDLYYRADPDDAHPIDVVLMAPDQPPIRGRVIDVFMDGVGVRLPRSTALPLGLKVDLGLSVKHGERPIGLSAVVRARKEGRSFRRYGFRFTSRAEIEEKLPRGLYSIFNRRRAERYYLTERIGVSVIPDGRFETLPAMLGDVSLVGASVMVEPKCENVLARADRMSLCIDQTVMHVVGEDGVARPATEPMIVDVLVHNRLLLDGIVRYGCEFDPNREDTDRKSRMLVDYVIHREGELQAAADAEAAGEAKPNSATEDAVDASDETGTDDEDPTDTPKSS